MWTKTIKVKFQNKFHQVQIWLDSDEDNRAIFRMRAMLNQYFLEEEVIFQNRDAAYTFIKNCPHEYAKEFLIREAYSSGAINS